MEKTPPVYEHGSCSSSIPEPAGERTFVIPGRKYALERMLGSGSTSIVRLGREVATGREVAIKIIDKDVIRAHKKKSLRRQMKMAIIREISIMKMLIHPNVVRLVEVMASKTLVYIVMELVTGGGALIDTINQSGQPGTLGMSECKARKYFHQLICAVDYCHSRGVAHRDLRPENLLLDANGVLKVADFGMSALPQQARQDGLLHSGCGTLDYAAPEMIMNRGYEGEKVDIWSCGVILFFLVAGHLPFRSEDNDRNFTIAKILQANFICPSYFSRSLITLITRILDPNPAKRITMNGIFENEWFMMDYKPPKFSQENISFDDDSQKLVAEGDEAGSSEPVPVMNAFEILNTFLGFNLIIGKLLNQLVQVKRETRFISQNHVDEIINGIERVAGIMGFDVKKRSNYQMSIEGGAHAGRKGHLYIDTKIYEIAQPFHMVELRKAEGDVLEFDKFCRHIYSVLPDLIWKGIAEPLDTETDAAGANTSTSTASSSGNTSTSTSGRSTDTT